MPLQVAEIVIKLLKPLKSLIMKPWKLLKPLKRLKTLQPLKK